MGNPYKVDLANNSDEVLIGGKLTFTDGANQPATPGAPIVRGPFSFAFNTPNLNNGVPFYTPTVGDILLNAWVELGTVWNGTTPLVDIGQFTAHTFGLFSYALTAQPLDGGSPFTTFDGLAVLADADLVTLSGVGAVLDSVGTSGGSSFGHGLDLLPSVAGTWVPSVPARFITTDPLLVVVSQNGLKGGPATGASQGAANIYIVVATPRAI